MQIDDIPVEQSSPADGTSHWEWTQNSTTWRISLTDGENNLKAYYRDTIWSWAFVEWVLPYDARRPALAVDGQDTRAAIEEYVRWTAAGLWLLGNRRAEPQPDLQPAPAPSQERE